MKSFWTLLLCAALIAGAGLWVNVSAATQTEKTRSVTFDVSLHCQNCKEKIEKYITWEKGVKDLSVDLDQKQVTIKYDPRKTDEATLKAAVEKLGYTCEKAGEKDKRKE